MQGIEQACSEGVTSAGGSLAVAYRKLQRWLVVLILITGAGGGSVLRVDGDCLADTECQQITRGFKKRGAIT